MLASALSTTQNATGLRIDFCVASAHVHTRQTSRRFSSFNAFRCALLLGLVAAKARGLWRLPHSTLILLFLIDLKLLYLTVFISKMTEFSAVIEPSNNAVLQFAEFHELPTFLPYHFIRDTVLPFIITSIIVLTVFYHSMLQLVQAKAPKSWNATVQNKVTYQLTNLTVNACLGTVGLYHFYYTLPDNPSLQEQVLGWQESLYPIAGLQIAYQLWAIVMGIFVVKESPAMILHHVCVILVSCMCSFMTIGFRYWTPFFLGMVELSSVPLAIMNTFKDYNVFIQQYPKVYFYVRLAFAFSFLIVRWFMFAPRKYIFLRQCMWAILSSTSRRGRYYQVFMSFVWISAFFLWCLQVFWGTLILKGLANVFIFSKEKKVVK